MRRSNRAALAVTVLLCSPVVSAAEPVTAAVQTTLSTGSRQIRQFAYDGNPKTFFVSKENPGAADHFTLVFDRPVSLKSVAVITGRADGGDALDEGLLEVSADGMTFIEAARFSGGEAHAGTMGKEAMAVRLKTAVSQSHPLAVREITVESEPSVAVFRYPVEFVVNAADSPEMEGWAGEVARLCERWYPRICDELKSDGYTPPHHITMRITKTYQGVAMAGGDRITGSTNYFKALPDDVGAMIHETTHIVQQYRGRGNPGWLVEGVADYIRKFRFEPDKRPQINPNQAHYHDSYQTTAVFLAYVADTYDKALVSKLNARMREGRYQEAVWQELTGKSVQELDAEWRATLRR